MQNNLTNTNISFQSLQNSPEFLNLVLNNIMSCVLLLNCEMRLVTFNDSLKTIFTNRSNEDLHYIRCGEAIGCAYQIEEATECGETSKCCTCELRIAGMKSYLNKKVIFKKQITKPFFNENQEKVFKHLQFSTRQFTFKKERYIILIIEDITELVNLRQKRIF